MTSLIPHGEPPRYFTFPALTAAGLPHASTTRHCPGVTSPSQPTSPFTSEVRETLAGGHRTVDRAVLLPGRRARDRRVHACLRPCAVGALDAPVLGWPRDA